MEKSAYQAHGFDNRKAYLLSLCDEYQRHMVFAAASVLGPNEDFDGLITTLEDAADSGEFDDCE